jgi:hypothetical protein
MAAEAPAPTAAETPTAETPAAEPAATSPPESAETVPREPSGSGAGEGPTGAKVAAWASLAVGVAGMVVGGVYSYYVSDANSKLDPYRRFDCAASPRFGCDRNGKPATGPLPDSYPPWMTQTQELANKYETYQWIGYGVGAAMLATSAVFFYYGYLSGASGAMADARGSSLQFAPVFMRGGVSAMAFATF